LLTPKKSKKKKKSRVQVAGQGGNLGTGEKDWYLFGWGGLKK